MWDLQPGPQKFSSSLERARSRPEVLGTGSVSGRVQLMNSRLLSIEKALSCGNYKPLMMRSNILWIDIYHLHIQNTRMFRLVTHVRARGNRFKT